MSVEVLHPAEGEPPSTRAQQRAERSCRLLLHVVCLAPVALFPIGLAWKICEHFFP